MIFLFMILFNEIVNRTFYVALLILMIEVIFILMIYEIFSFVL